MQVSSGTQKLIVVIVVLSILMICVLGIFLIIGSVRITDGCLLRYSKDANGTIVLGSKITNSKFLQANGNYTVNTNPDAEGNYQMSLDPNSYNQWMDTGVNASPGQTIEFSINDEVSLCKSYLPLNNIASDTNTDKDGHPIVVPRLVGEGVLQLPIKSSTNEWRNVVEIFPGDKVLVSVKPSGTSYYDPFQETTITADCSANKTQYHPICGRYSPLHGQSYASDCKMQCQLLTRCSCYYDFSWAWPEDDYTTWYDTPCIKVRNQDNEYGRCPRDQPATWYSANHVAAIVNLGLEKKVGPAPYLDDGSNSIPEQVLEKNQIESLNATTCVWGSAPDDPNNSDEAKALQAALNACQQCKSSSAYQICNAAAECIACKDYRTANNCSDCDDTNKDCNKCSNNTSCKQRDANANCVTCQKSQGPTAIVDTNLPCNACKIYAMQSQQYKLPLYYDSTLTSDQKKQYIIDASKTTCVDPNTGQSATCGDKYIPQAVLDVCKNFPDQFPSAIKNTQVQPVPVDKFWCTDSDGCGIMYRITASPDVNNPEIITDEQLTGYLKKDGKIVFSLQANDIDEKAQSEVSYNAETKEIIQQQSNTQSIRYLQMRLYDKSVTQPNDSGGYILNVKHTKCIRKGGGAFTDTFADRGMVQYLIVPSGQNPNDPNYSGQPTNITSNDGSTNKLVVDENSKGGKLWMKILNKPEDAKDSSGQYTIKFTVNVAQSKFMGLILNPLFEYIKGTIKSASQKVFKQMICYRTNDASLCNNFFSYIKAVLVLYIMSYAMMFLLGMVQISQTDLVIRIAKIAIVSGLLNENTFNFFNNYVFDFVTGFSDQIIANIGGYSLFLGSNSVSNPFMFLDAIMSKMLFSITFYAQVLALLAFGLQGVLYFIVVMVAIVLFVIAALRAIAIYLMAFLAIAVLVGIAPLFLTFMLFEFTKPLFDNWVRFTFRYMIEPTVLMAGLIILTQLFTIYLDNVTGYSVCWKCALGFKIPFTGLIGFNPAFVNMDLFCFNWFAPWGLGVGSDAMGINFQHIIALMIISYCVYGYAQFSSKLVVQLTGTAGPSATGAGMAMADHFEQSALKRYGLDRNTRAQIKQRSQLRAKARTKAISDHNKKIGKAAKHKPSKEKKQNANDSNSSSEKQKNENT